MIFVDRVGILRERFFEIFHVPNTIALSRYNLHITNMRCQGYDGASNMSGAWNGLQALFLKEYPYAYYVHCFAHRLQLDLVGASTKKPVFVYLSQNCQPLLILLVVLQNGTLNYILPKLLKLLI